MNEDGLSAFLVEFLPVCDFVRLFGRYTLDHILSSTTTTNLFYRNTPSFAIIIRPVSQGLCRPAPMRVEDLAASMQAGDHVDEKGREWTTARGRAVRVCFVIPRGSSSKRLSCKMSTIPISTAASVTSREQLKN
ncbi:uncharacterized protein K489DRAFT_139025 [Dissoconium aciculare CBS 342.82]|uniref:Uncharacterized protein n=1 Tax=Dissoconium aciculare CBS 342.82 TaxID=1314786 RepID=A0A6J3LQD5_9PEZI|nr:uncharacterized protein K489DRAFT_139025 [Dissoconium aciculare CBS 342.82]KAF1817848.1 hypothetical protein K489DRAFT_139025 [Dissoconium aciculare CBS 342.82]